MKSSLAFCLLALGFTAVQAQETKITLPTIGGATAAAPAAPEPTFTDMQLVEEFGWFIGKRVGLTELAFSKEEVDALVKGLTSAANGKDSPFDLEKIGPKMDEFMQKKQTAFMNKLKAKNEADNAAFFAKLKENKNVVELPSGLRYEILKAGEGPSPKATDVVKVHYHGTMVDGSVFDSSVQRGEPVEFPLDGVIPGWTEGVQKANKGGKIKLYVPPALGYGDEGKGSIPPGSLLIFEVELLDFKAPPSPTMPSMPLLPPAGK